MKSHKGHLAWVKSYTKMSILTLCELNYKKSQKSQELHKNMAHKRYLIDGMGVAAWLFWEFFHARWKVDMRWELPHEVRIVMWGDFCMVEGTTQHEGMWVGCEVRIATWGKNVHTRWLLYGQGDNSPYKHKVDMRWEWSHEVRMVMQGDFCMVEGTSYTFPPKVISHPCEMAKLPQVDTRWLWMRCYLCDGQSANDEDFQKFPLYTFAKSPRMVIPTLRPPHVTISHFVWAYSSHVHLMW